MICPNYNNPKVKEQFNKVVEIFGGKPLTDAEFKDGKLRDKRSDKNAIKAAYFAWDYYKGVDIPNEAQILTDLATHPNVKSRLEYHTNFAPFDPTKDYSKENTDWLFIPNYIRNRRQEIHKLRKQLQILNSTRPKDKAVQENLINSKIEQLENDIRNIQDFTRSDEVAKVIEYDIDTMKQLLNKPKLTAMDLHTIDIRATMIANASDLFLRAGSANNEAWVKGNASFKGFQYYEAQANLILNELSKKYEDFVNDTLYKVSDMTVENAVEYLKDAKDISVLTSNLIDLSGTGIRPIQLLDKHIKELNIKASDALHNDIEAIHDIKHKADAVISRLGAKGYDVFKQLTKTGKETGRLIDIFSSEFYTTRNAKWATALEKQNSNDWVSLMDWTRDNTLTVDFRKLFPDSQLYNSENVNEGFTEYNAKDRQDHIDEIVKNVGQREWDRMFVQLQKQYDAFKANALSIREAFEEEYSEDAATLEREWNIWLFKESPYMFSYLQENPTRIVKIGGSVIYSLNGHKHTMNIPLRVSRNGKKTDWYDERFDTVVNNPVLYEFYNKTIDMLNALNEYLPEDQRPSMTRGMIPHFKKTLFEAFADTNIEGKKNLFLDSVMQRWRANGLDELMFGYVDGNGEVSKDLQLTNINNNSKAINDVLTRKIADFMIANPGASIDAASRLKLKEEAIDEVAKTQSFDLPRIMTMYSTMIHTYKYKIQSEDLLNFTKKVIDNTQEKYRDQHGNFVKDNNNINDQLRPNADSFKNLRDQFNYYYRVYYGQNKQMEGVSKVVKYTSEEKKVKAELEVQIEALESYIPTITNPILAEQYTNTLDRLKKQLANLGGNYAASQVFREVIKFSQLKGMGWNLFSAINNMSFGFITNFVEGSMGRIFTSSEIRKAYGYLGHSILRNSSFHLVTTPTAKRIRSLMGNWEIEADLRNELMRQHEKGIFKGKAAFLDPYNLQGRTEYLNQASILVARLLHVKVKFEGKDIPIFECFDEKGKWNPKYGEEPKELLDKERLLVKQTIKLNHGNYYRDSPILANDTAVKTAAKQFKQWMFESVRTRMQVAKYDDLLGMTVKGRYRTLFEIIRNPKELSMANNENYALEDTRMNSLIFLGINHLKLLTGGLLKTNIEDRFNETDAANLRGVMTEISAYMLIMMSTLLLGAFGGDDDQQKRKRYMYNYLINIG